MKKRPALFCVLILAVLLCSCSTAASAPIQLYSDLSPDDASAIAQAFTEQTGIPVEVTFCDASAAQEKLAQEDDPGQVLLFSQEGLGDMAALDDAGLLDSGINMENLLWPLCGTHFAGIGGDTWVLICNNDLVGDNIPDSIFDLNDYGVGQAGLPDPSFYPLYITAILGNYDQELALEFAQEAITNEVTLVPDPHSAAYLVGKGDLSIAVTTYGAAKTVADQGSPVTIVIPDQEEGDIGTVVTPLTVAIVKGRSAGDTRVAQLAQWLVGSEAQTKLMELGLVDLSVLKPLEQTGTTIWLVQQRVGDALAQSETVLNKLGDLMY